MLERTKVSEAGKFVEQLEVPIAAGAYLAVRAWLETGYELWRGAMGQHKCLVGIPTEDLRGILVVATEYQE